MKRVILQCGGEFEDDILVSKFKVRKEMWAGHGNNFEDFGTKDGVVCIGEVELEDDESKFRLLKVPPNCVDAVRNSFGRSSPVEAEVKLMEVCKDVLGALLKSEARAQVQECLVDSYWPYSVVFFPKWS